MEAVRRLNVSAGILGIHKYKEKWTQTTYPNENLKICDDVSLPRYADVGKELKRHGGSFGVQELKSQNVNSDWTENKLFLLFISVALPICVFLNTYVIDTKRLTLGCYFAVNLFCRLCLDVLQTTRLFSILGNWRTMKTYMHNAITL